MNMIEIYESLRLVVEKLVQIERRLIRLETRFVEVAKRTGQKDAMYPTKKEDN